MKLRVGGRELKKLVQPCPLLAIERKVVRREEAVSPLYSVQIPGR